MSQNNLPIIQNSDSSQEIKSFFDTYYQKEISFPVNQIDTVLGYFLKRGFDELSARGISIVLLTQAKIDNINVFHLIDTLKGLTDVQLSAVVTEILNSNREKTSMLGFRNQTQEFTLESRNIRV